MRLAKSINNNFPLLKYFSMSSMVLIIIVIMAMSFLYRHYSVKTLITYGEQSNAVLTQALSNTIWPSFKPFAAEAATMSKEELEKSPQINNLNQMVLAHIRNTPILKIKIFDLNGKTIFSTDYSQLAVQKPANYGGSISARSGEVISELSFRESFDSPDGKLYKRQIVSSYLPIRDADESGNAIAGVFEVYYDVTETFSELEKQQYVAFGIISTLLLTLYAILYFIVKRADRIIYFQSINIKNTLEKYEDKCKQLHEAINQDSAAENYTKEFLSNLITDK